MGRFTRAFKHLKEQERSRQEGHPDRMQDHPIAIVGKNSVQAAETASSATKVPSIAADPIRIDADALRVAGLLPPPEHEENLRRQFRRIKRPVIDNAFNLGLPRGDNANVVMIASALPGAGKTFASMNLVMSIARERDIGAILIDADVLKPKCTVSLGAEKRPGLIDYLLSDSADIESILVPTDLPGLRFIPAGSPHADATELLASNRMKLMIERLSVDYGDRIIVVDTPPLLVTNEAQVLAQHMGQILLVIREGGSSQSSVLDALEMLDRSKPINAILNQARHLSVGNYGSLYYGYADYGAGRTRDEIE